MRGEAKLCEERRGEEKIEERDGKRSPKRWRGSKKRTELRNELRRGEMDRNLNMERNWKRIEGEIEVQ